MCRNRHIAFLNQTNASKHIPHHNFRAKIRFGEVPGGIFERKIRCFVNFFMKRTLNSKKVVIFADAMESDADLDAFTPNDHSVGSSMAEELLLFCTTFNYLFITL